MTRRFFACLSVILPLCAVPFVGCSDSGDDDTGATSGHAGLEGYEDVGYEGGTTDEALIALVAAMEKGLTVDAAQAPVLDAPLDEVPAASPPTFAWHVGAQSKRGGHGLRHAAVPPPCPWPEPVLLQADARRAARQGTFLERALEAALSGVRSAHAHGDPFNGYGTMVAVASSDNPKLARVFTGGTSWTPSATQWQAMVAAGDVTVNLVGAEFEENRLPQGTGVYQGSSTSFTIAP